ncbi:hypothetical protein [Paenibacillus sp. FSL R7-0652]|uniref:Transposase DDE domain-containing protein n=1 Tax=Paenibacillus sp. AN1007 TaxID=3151385 RepID=A0AAU8NDN9_9BACL
MLWDVVVMAQQSGTASGYRLGSIRYEHHSKKQRERVERSFCICRERAAEGVCADERSRQNGQDIGR